MPFLGDHRAAGLPLISLFLSMPSKSILPASGHDALPIPTRRPGGDSSSVCAMKGGHSLAPALAREKKRRGLLCPPLTLVLPDPLLRAVEPSGRTTPSSQPSYVLSRSLLGSNVCLP